MTFHWSGFSRRVAALCVATLAVWALDSTLFAREAAAQARIPVAFGYGDEISRLGDVTDREVADALTATMGRGVAVGYKYRQIIIGAPLWTWDGEYCVYAGKRYRVIPEVLAAKLAGVPAGTLRTPFFYRYPFGLVLLGLFVIVAPPAAVVSSRYLARRQRRAQAAYEASFVTADTPTARPQSTLFRD
jgi:hypothetical protein